MALDTLTTFLGWTALINIIVLLLSTGMVLVVREKISRYMQNCSG